LRPNRSAQDPAGSSTAAFTPATMKKPMPVQTMSRWSPSTTKSGSSAERTPITAQPSAKFAASAAR